MNAQLTFIHALSPLHAGTGQGAGVIDLPVAREKATNIPFLPGSSLKGALRTRCFTENSEHEEARKECMAI
ncbi:MAG TPA: RAMP superfamily CRISPR-associated protein, partial [Ktedonobacteraceae bacterium]